MSTSNSPEMPDPNFLEELKAIANYIKNKKVSFIPYEFDRSKREYKEIKECQYCLNQLTKLDYIEIADKEASSAYEVWHVKVTPKGYHYLANNKQ